MNNFYDIRCRDTNRKNNAERFNSVNYDCNPKQPFDIQTGDGITKEQIGKAISLSKLKNQISVENAEKLLAFSLPIIQQLIDMKLRESNLQTATGPPLKPLQPAPGWTPERERLLIEMHDQQQREFRKRM
jgi:hypothetical protein